MGWHVGDLEPDLVITVLDAPGGTGVDLTGRTAEIHMRKPSGDLIERAATLADQTATPGRLSMAWQSGDLDEVGPHQVEVELDSATRPQTIGPVTVTVAPELA